MRISFVNNLSKVTQIRIITTILFLAVFLGCYSSFQAEGKKLGVLIIADYGYALPSWWDNVDIDVPESLENESQIRNYVRKHFKKDTGTKDTWKEALKTWAIASQRINHFPTYLAHCHRNGGEYERAVEIYTDLYKLADKQKDDRDWYRVYLAHNAGNMFVLLKDFKNAALWYGKSAEYIGHEDSAINYYAQLSAKEAKGL